ncbi:hypothetical protein ScPMuIL_016858 [Solemya velum]
MDDETGFAVYYYGLYFPMFLINVIGNPIVICTILRHERLRKPTNYFLVSLATSDLLIGILYPIYSLGHLPALYGILGHWTLCMAVLPVLNGLLTVSAFHLVGLTITRYICIVKYYKQNELITPRRILVGIVATWLLALGSTLPRYIIEKPANYNNTCKYELLYSPDEKWGMLIGQFLIPLLVMVALYLKILITVKKKMKMKCHSGIESKRRAILVLTLLCWFALSYIPLSMYLVVSVTVHNISRYVSATVRLLAYSNSLINVFIYAGRLKDFRKCFISDIRKICSLCFVREPSSRNDDSVGIQGIGLMSIDGIPGRHPEEEASS